MFIFDVHSLSFFYGCLSAHLFNLMFHCLFYVISLFILLALFLSFFVLSFFVLSFFIRLLVDRSVGLFIRLSGHLMIFLFVSFIIFACLLGSFHVFWVLAWYNG